MGRQVAGFTMVEVLVAVLLLAVGLVGALAMQAHAMRTRQESALLTEAMQAAATLADRIRANAAQSSAYLGFEFDAATAVAAGDVPAAADCSVAECDAAALAQYDLGAFRQQLQSSLPAARALTCRDFSAAPGGQWQWACSGEANAPIVIKIGWRSSNASGIGSARGVGPAIALPVALFGPGSTP
jgi:type IV pilus assembly protein PilV